MDVNANSDITLISSKNNKIDQFSNFHNKTKVQGRAKDIFIFTPDLRMDIYNAEGKIVFPKSEEDTLYDGFQNLKNTIKLQLNSLFDSYIQNEDNAGILGTAHENLKSYFTENPEALKQVASGEIPEYWNKANTAERIYSIAVMGFKEDGDREELYEKALNMVNRAYDEVHTMIGFDFPGIVMETKQAVLDALIQFKEGEDPVNITFS